MTGPIIWLRGDDHQEARTLLPWYLTGRLDPSERALVEAHLDRCPECQAEARSERRLAAEIAAAEADAPSDVEQSWARFSLRFEVEPPRRARLADLRAWIGDLQHTAVRQLSVSPPWLRWAVAGQFSLLVAIASFLPQALHKPIYHALGAAPAAASGDIVVIFHPDITERQLRETLKANDARVVDGPTETDAYLLHVPKSERAAVLERLRRQGRVELAEPVDSGASP